MFELIKGDFNNLEGRVMIYAESGEDLCPTLIEQFKLHESLFKEPLYTYVIFCSTNAAEVVKKSGVPAAELAQEMEDCVEMMRSEREITVPMYMTQLICASKEEAICSESDVFYTGKWKNPGNCINSTLIGHHIYTLRFGEQELARSHSKKNDDGKNKSLDELITYRTLASIEIGRYVTSRFLGPMIDERKRGNTDQFRKLEEEFKRFANGAPFFRDVESLCSVLKDGGDKMPNIPLATAYFKRIDAVACERYEDAARLTHEIVALTGKL